MCLSHPTGHWLLLLYFWTKGSRTERGIYKKKKGFRAASLQIAALLEDGQFSLFFFHSLKAFQPFSDSLQAPELLLPHILYLCYGCTGHISWEQQAEEKADSKFCHVFAPFTQEWENQAWPWVRKVLKKSWKSGWQSIYGFRRGK